MRSEHSSNRFLHYRGPISLLILGPMILLAILFISLCAVASGPVNIFHVDSYEKVADVGTVTEFRWVVYNNASEGFLVQLSVEPYSDREWSAAFEQDFLTLDPGEDETITLEITTSRTMGSLDLDLNVTFLMNELDNPTITFQVVEQVHLEIVSLFGTRAGENKIFGIWDNFLPPPLDTNYGAFAITLMGWVGIALAVALVVDPVVRSFTRKTKTDLDDRLLKIIRGPLFALILLFGIVNSLEILNIPTDIIATVELAYSIFMVFIIVWLAYRIYDNIVIYYAQAYAKKTEMEVDDVIIPLFEKIGMIMIPLFGLIAIFDILGFDVTMLLAGVGVLGVVIGFAAQSTLANFFAGIQLLMDRPFGVGDLILLDDGRVCEVRKIGMRSITLYDIFKHSLVIVPNNEMANRQIVNIVQPDQRYKISVTVGVAYGSDVKNVESILMKSALDHSNVLKDEGHLPVVRFESFGDSALVFTIYLWIDDVRNQWKVGSELRETIDEAFRREGIEIPFPQRTVWLRETKKQS